MTVPPMCQSCGLPMEIASEHGTEPDGSLNFEYCCHCYRKGRFIEPNLTVDDMLQRMAGIVQTEMFLPPKKALDVARTFVPQLKRWQRG